MDKIEIIAFGIGIAGIVALIAVAIAARKRPSIN
jgi:hypothetical protein